MTEDERQESESIEINPSIEVQPPSGWDEILEELLTEQWDTGGLS